MQRTITAVPYLLLHTILLLSELGADVDDKPHAKKPIIIVRTLNHAQYIALLLRLKERKDAATEGRLNELLAQNAYSSDRSNDNVSLSLNNWDPSREQTACVFRPSAYPKADGE